MACKWFSRHLDVRSINVSNFYDSIQAQLKESGFDNEADLDATIKKLEEGIQRARNKELGIDENDDKVSNTSLVSMQP